MKLPDLHLVFRRVPRLSRILYIFGVAVFVWSTLAADAQATQVCNTASTICYDPITYPVVIVTASYSVVPGKSYQATTLNLASLPGITNYPDTILWVVDTATNNVLGVNDDYASSLSSQVVFTVTAATTVKIIVAGYASGSMGTCDIELAENSTAVWSTTGKTFGGWRLSNKDVRSGDTIFVGVPPDGQDHTAYQNRLLRLTNSTISCSSNCGSFEMATDVAGMSRLDVSTSSTDSHFLVGSSLPTVSVSTRLFHVRRATGWGSGSQFEDLDGDGLTSELEGATSTDPSLNVGTCDSGLGPMSYCTGQAAKFTAGTWHAYDTDNDGFRDGWEVFGVRKTCSKLPVTPYFYPGTCTDITWAGSVQFGEYEEPLSAFDVRPDVYDALVESAAEVDPKGTGTGYGDWYPTQTTLDYINWIYSEEGKQCAHVDTTDHATYCPTESQYEIGMQLHPGLQLSPVDESESSYSGVHGYGHHMYRSIVARGYFNVRMNPDRKYTNTFRYQVSTNVGSKGGEAVYQGRIAQNYGGDSGAARTLAHEIGHNMGLHHGGFEGNRGKLNYPSVMSYRHGTMPAKAVAGVDGDLLPDDFGTACTVDATCSSGKCWTAGYCGFIQTSLGRFSKGLLPTLDETGLSKLNLNPNLGAIAAGQSYSVVPTGVDLCAIDWDGGGYLVPSAPHDVNNDNDTTDTAVKDHNDWERMTNLAKNGLTSMAESTFIAYASNFASTVAIDYSAYHITPSVTGTITATGPNETVFSEALVFPGPCSGTGCAQSAVVVGPSPPIHAMGGSLDTAVTPQSQGFLVDVMVRIDADPLGASGHQVLFSDLFEIDVPRSGTNSGKFRAWIDNGSGSKTDIVSTVSPVFGEWYRVRLTWKQTASNGSPQVVRLTVMPFDGAGEVDFTNAKCTSKLLAWQQDLDPGEVVFGQYKSAGAYDSAWSLKGALDEPLLETGVVVTGKYSDYNLDNVTCSGVGGKAND